MPKYLNVVIHATLLHLCNHTNYMFDDTNGGMGGGGVVPGCRIGTLCAVNRLVLSPQVVRVSMSSSGGELLVLSTAHHSLVNGDTPRCVFQCLASPGYNIKIIRECYECQSSMILHNKSIVQ